MKTFISTLILLIFPLWLSAQERSNISGSVKDYATGEPLIAATVCLINQQTPDNKSYTTSNMDGNFTFSSIATGSYRIEVTYVGYKKDEKTLHVSEAKNYKVFFRLKEDAQLLDEISVQGRATRAEQKGDSLLYNADAFKVMQGSSAEDLLSKMPGVVVEGGKIQAQGEDVKKILIDGKEFFEGDVNLAVKNIPADVIASIEVFDKKSEQAEFTGFDDGEEIKTINIITKGGFKEGTFGEIYAGYGTDNRYKAGGNINFFNDDQRISILGMSNNVNQQNFSQEDLAGVMSSSSSGKRGSRGNGKNGGGNATNDFIVNSTAGVSTSNGLGVNYVDQWNDKVKFTGSYFFNQSDNLTEQQTEREYFESSLPGLTYDEYKNNEMKNWNHRINMKLDYQIDENNSIQIRPNLSFQNNSSFSLLQGTNSLNGNTETETENKTSSSNNAYNVGANIIYRHKFSTPGRTLSWNISGNMTNNAGESYTDYLNKVYGPNLYEESYSQFKDNTNRQYNFRSSLMFTEKLSDAFQMSAGYKVSYSNSDSDKKTYNQSSVTDLYDQLDENLSSVYQSGYLTQAGSVGLRYKKGKFNAMIGTDVQWSSLNGELTYPYSGQIKHDYFSLLPSLMARYSVDRNNSFMLRYRSSSSAPSVTDLQDVIDNSNPLFMSAGNPNLDQQTNHTLNIRYTHTTKSGQTFIAMLGGTLRNNYVADSTFIAAEDMELSPDITLNKGSQFTRPVNLDGYYSLQSMFTYGFPVDFIKSNINISLAANYANVPTIFNGVESNTQELNLIPKLIVGSNISRNLDFTASYAAGFNKLFSSQPGSYTGDYLTHTATFKLGWTFLWGLTFRNTLNYIGYSGLSNGNDDCFLWNVSLGKKFLKNDAAEIRLEAFDILKQNKAFTHQTGSNYYDYINSNVLKPYAMLTFVYTIR